MRSQLDGTETTEVYSSSSSHGFGPSSIAIDNLNGRIYWCEYSSSLGNNYLWRADISSIKSTKTMWSNNLSRNYGYSITIDETNGKGYLSVNSYYNIAATIGNGMIQEI
jgi:hypothetical protein